jgi:hypothetical protein
MMRLTLTMATIIAVGCSSPPPSDDVGGEAPKAPRAADDEGSRMPEAGAAPSNGADPQPQVLDAAALPPADAGSALVEVSVDIKGDCVKATCPANAPNLVGCALDFQGDDDRGCVARTGNASEIFLKEGNSCGAGRVVGKILCSSVPSAGAALDAKTCPIDKKTPIYAASPNDCPQ